MTRRPLTRGGTTRCFFSIPTTVGQVKPGALVLWTRIAWEKPGNFCRRRRPALGYRRAHGKPTTSSPRARHASDARALKHVTFSATCDAFSLGKTDMRIRKRHSFGKGAGTWRTGRELGRAGESSREPCSAHPREQVC